jgi:sulfite reductase (NADPH) hemoprotein beta-component
MSGRSRNEVIKEASRALRGTLAEGLAWPETGAVAEDDTQLTKFHGIYQQDDRDLRPERTKRRMEKAFSFMARVRIPAGRLTTAQYLALDAIARERGNATLRLTTRQTVQFHGIVKTNLRAAMQALHANLMDTIAACGDVNRNVIASVHAGRSAAHAAAAELATAVSAHLLPRSHAWHEIFLDGEPVPPAGAAEEEPVYGRAYLPRKFKIAIAVPPQNDVDVFAHDLGFIAVAAGGAGEGSGNGTVTGWNVTVGGGMGMTHGEPDTFPRTADVIGSCATEQVLAIAEAVMTTQRDWGDRADRKHARLKYTIERRGLADFVAEVERRAGFALAPARPVAFAGTGDAIGWVRRDDGFWDYCQFVENGRVAGRLAEGLRTLARAHPGEFVLTPNQNLVVAGIAGAARPVLEAILREHGLDAGAGTLRRHAMACVALPSCGLALAESERALPALITRLDAELAAAGLADAPITLRMTGCPNGCARPYLAEIGLVGTGPDAYNLYLGAAANGTRLNKLYRRSLSPDGIVAALAPLFRAYAAGRRRGEAFGDFVIRAGIVRETAAGNRFHADLAPEPEAAESG